MISDRAPQRTSGYGIRVSNVIDGLLVAGDLHVCVVDSSFDGIEFPHDDRYSASTVRAAEFPFWRRALQRLWTIPNLAYVHEHDLRARVEASVGADDWDLVWFSRIRVHRLSGDLVGGRHIIDLDDLNDRLQSSLASERLKLTGLTRFPRSVTNHVLARRWKRRYRLLFASDDHLVVTHDGDRLHLGHPRCAVVPNGYPPVAAPPTPPSDGSSMLFVGPLSYEPNHLGVTWLVEHVIDLIRAEIPDASLTVVGDLTNAEALPQHPAVRYVGFAVDVAPHYERATIAVAPVWSGGGTRIKVLEAMARRRPVVATSFAVEGLGVVDGEDVLTADTAESFAAHCIALLTDRDERERLAAQAHQTFSSGHTAAHASDAVRDLVRSVLSMTDGAPGRAA